MYNVHMRRLFVLACLPLLMSSTQPLPVRHANIIACGPIRLDPFTPAELAERSDVVVHVRFDAQSAFDHEYVSRVLLGGHPGENVWEDRVLSDVYTAHDASVLALLKGDPHAVVEGANHQIFQRGGRIQRADYILVETVNHEEPLPMGTEWVLFLHWSDELSGFGFSAHDAIQIEGGRVASRVGSLDSAWAGREIAELRHALSR
jgi:hypothetical protein